MRLRTVLGVRMAAIGEVLTFMILLFFADTFFGAGNRFIDVQPHPLWVILLLVLFQYSVQEALVTIVLMCVFLYAWNLPPQYATQSLFNYYFNLATPPALWIGMTILLGGIRLRSNSKLIATQRDLKKAREQERAISESFVKLKAANRALELRLSEELGSAIKIYRAAVTLEGMERENQIDGINRIVASILNPEKFSIFTMSGEGMELNSSYAWTDGDKLSRRFDRTSALCKAVATERRLLSVFNADDERILKGEGLLAGPLIDNASGEVFGMLKIEAMDFQSFNLRTLQLFKMLCEWTGLTMKKMKGMRKLAGETITSREHHSYSYAFLQAQTDFLDALARRIGFHLTKLNIRMVNQAELSTEERRLAAAAMSAAIKSTLRKTDLLFDARERGEEYALLLCGTGTDNAGIVIQKIQDNLAKTATKEMRAKYAFSTQAIFHSDRNPAWQGPK